MNNIDNELENKLSVPPFKKQMFSKQFMNNVEQKIKMLERKNIWNTHKIVLFSLSFITILGLFIGLTETGLIHKKDNETTAVPTGTPTPQSIIYENVKYNFTLTLPNSWDGKYEVVDRIIEANNIENIDFINIANKEAGWGGVLFTIQIWSQDKWSTDGVDEAKNIQISKIGEKEDKIFSLSTPSDVNYNVSNEKLKAEYASMWDDIKTIKPTFDLLENK
jgi:hypothetical protein